MADEALIRILQERGVEAWNEWKNHNPGAPTDLSGADFSFANLINANLDDANMAQADLSEANLSEAQVRRAIFTCADLHNAKFGRANLSAARFGYANCKNASFVEADLENSYFHEANLIKAGLRGAKLRHANLTLANLAMASLIDADFSDSYITSSNLAGTSLLRANLRNSDLRGANLSGSILQGADVTDSTMGYTLLSALDLSGVIGLETVKHETPSSIGLDTLFLSGGNIPRDFLRGVGVPEHFLSYIKSLTWSGIEFYSCFISHSSKDADFAAKINQGLRSSGVRCWYFPEDAKWGESIWGEIDSSIKTYDKLVVVCSENSLQSEPVIREIERALQREDKEKRSVLFPIRIDDYLLGKWDHPRKADVLSKVVGDFRHWRNPNAYQNALNKLVAALNKPIGPVEQT